MLLFVYGTLCKGLSRNDVIKGSEYLGLALCKGILKDVGSFPALINGDENVIGEVYRIDSDTVLPVLDRIEGYYGNDESSSLYLRKKMSVRMLSDGKWVDAVSYFFNRGTENLPNIEIRDYRQYLLNQENGSIFYLAYGSNLSMSRMKKRIGNWKQAINGTLSGYRLVYNKRPSSGKLFAFANITTCVEGFDCPCVAYEIDRECLLTLDRYEGFPYHYIRTVLPMITEHGKELMGYVYVAHPDKLVLNRRASDEYRGHLLKGYEDHGLGELVEFESSIET